MIDPRVLGRGAPAARSSRRTALRVLTAGVLAGLLTRLGTTRVAADRVTICHKTGSTTKPFVKMEIGEGAVAEHEAHGDVIDPVFPSDSERCDDCGNACGVGKTCQASACVPCGTLGAACCAGSTCGEGLTCDPNQRKCAVVCDREVDDCDPAGND